MIHAYSKASCTVADIVAKKLGEISLCKGDASQVKAINTQLIPSLIAGINDKRLDDMRHTQSYQEAPSGRMKLWEVEHDLNTAACQALAPVQYLSRAKTHSGKTKFKSWLAYSSFEGQNLSSWVDKYEGQELRKLKSTPAKVERKERTLQGLSLSALANGQKERSLEHLSLLSAAVGCSYEMSDYDDSGCCDELMVHYLKSYDKSPEHQRAAWHLAVELEDLGYKSEQLFSLSQKLISATRDYAHYSKLRSVKKIFDMMPVNFDRLVLRHKDNCVHLDHDLKALQVLAQYGDSKPYVKWHQAVASCEKSLKSKMDLLLQDQIVCLQTMERSSRSLCEQYAHLLK